MVGGRVSHDMMEVIDRSTWIDRDGLAGRAWAGAAAEGSPRQKKNLTLRYFES